MAVFGVLAWAIAAEGACAGTACHTVLLIRGSACRFLPWCVGCSASPLCGTSPASFTTHELLQSVCVWLCLCLYVCKYEGLRCSRTHDEIIEYLLSGRAAITYPKRLKFQPAELLGDLRVLSTILIVATATSLQTYESTAVQDYPFMFDEDTDHDNYGSSILVRAGIYMLPRKLSHPRGKCKGISRRRPRGSY